MGRLTLVTGGSGYFGCLLTARLRQRGERVRILDVNDTEDRPADVEIFRGDIRDAELVRRACEGVDVVHHNVALVPLAKDKKAFWSVNRDGTEILLKACAKAGVKKVISMSSSAVFGVPPKNPVDDSVAPDPQEDYGRAKLAGEELCDRFRREGLDITIIRPRTIMGHGRLGIMQIIFEWIREGFNVPVLGGGNNVYQFVHADDLADACILASEKAGPATYNIGTDRYLTMRQTLEGLIAHAGTGSKVRSLPMGLTVALMNLSSGLGLSPLGPYHSLMYGKSMYFDLTRPMNELGWKPRFGNVEMFAESYDWYVAHRGELANGQQRSHHRSPVKQGILGILKHLL